MQKHMMASVVAITMTETAVQRVASAWLKNFKFAIMSNVTLDVYASIEHFAEFCIKIINDEVDTQDPHSPAEHWDNDE